MTDQQIQDAKAATALVPVGETGLSLSDLSTVFVKSGFFKDVREQSQAIVKILLGQELGLKPIQAMMGIHIVEGKPEISAALMAALVKRSGRYDYEVKHHDDEGCAIEFFSLANGQRTPCGVSEFTMHDAQRAGLANRGNWKAYPRNMCFARAMSNGVKWYTGDAVGGLPIYTDGEISDAGQDRPRPAPGPEPVSERHSSGEDIMPREKAPEPAQAEIAAPAVTDPPKAAPVAQDGPAPRTRAPKKPSGANAAAAAPVQEEAGAVVPTSGAGGASPSAPATSAAAPVSPGGYSTFFTINNTDYGTKGITREQMLQTWDLTPKVDKKLGKGTARGYLAKILGVAPADVDRRDANEEQAARWIHAMEQSIAT